MINMKENGMSNTKQFNDGGPAYPVNDDSDGGLHRHSGMTLRDWFAGMALQGLIASSVITDITCKQYAGCAYRHADAMLKAREVLS